MNKTQALAYDPAMRRTEAAEYLSISSRKVMELTAKGILGHFRTEGGHYRYRLSDLNAYVESVRIPVAND